MAEHVPYRILAHNPLESDPSADQLFRTAPSSLLLSGFGDIFREQYQFATSAFSAAKRRASVTALPPNVARSTHDMTEAAEKIGVVAGNKHAHADSVYFMTLLSTKADAFLSHTWMDSAFLKYLALCYTLNLQHAVIAGWIAWFVIILGLLATHDWDVTSMGGLSSMKHLFLLGPAGVFFLAFFFAHTIIGNDKQWWLDKMCIHQTRDKWKLAAVHALPDFVATSDNLIMLWSEVYFSRLWCCCELATFLATHSAADIIVQPLWLAPWVLSTIGTDVFCGYFVAYLLETTFPWFTETYGTWGPVPALAFTFGVGYAPSLVPNLIAFRAKARAHKHLLAQLHGFSLANCKCTVESDRAHVESHITKLYISHDKPIRAFEATVREDFLKVVVDSIGAGSSMPLSLALLPFLPLFWSSMFDIFACDGGPCAEIAPLEGFAKPWELVAGIAVAWFFCMVMCFPSIYPFIFWGLGYTEEFSNLWKRNVGGAFVIVSTFTIAGGVVGIGSTMGYAMIATHGDPVWTGSYFLMSALCTFGNYVVFCGLPSGRTTSRPQSGKPVSTLDEGTHDVKRSEYFTEPVADLRVTLH